MGRCIRKYTFSCFASFPVYITFFCLLPKIPFDNFVRTNAGELSQHQMPMHRERIKSIGISILGANSGVEGKYELGLDTIKLVNEDDVTYAPPGTYSTAI